VFYPLSVLPTWVQAIARVIPATYVFEGMRGIVLRQGAPTAPLIWGTALALLYVGLAWVGG
jgi:ABC-2 type transport system permease protein